MLPCTQTPAARSITVMSTSLTSQARPVYRDYDQAQLDAEYNNRARFPDYKEHFDNWTKWSEATRSRLPGMLDVAFGKSELEKLDIFPAEQPGAPIYVFIHGGYWYSLDKSHYSYVADGMRPHGITTVVNNFALAPNVDMDTIVDQNRGALAWLWRNAESFGADRNSIYVCGHSAGGHLGLMLLATDWPKYGEGLPCDVVKGVCSIGGIFDLEPIRLSFLNKTLHMDGAQAKRNSPLSQTYRFPAPLSLVIAVDESDEFHRQSREMQNHWATLNYPTELLVPPGLDHFNVVNELANPACGLVQHQLEQMKIAFAPR
jgi:arylformamidase